MLQSPRSELSNGRRCWSELVLLPRHTISTHFGRSMSLSDSDQAAWSVLAWGLPLMFFPRNECNVGGPWRQDSRQIRRRRLRGTSQVLNAAVRFICAGCLKRQAEVDNASIAAGGIVAQTGGIFSMLAAM